VVVDPPAGAVLAALTSKDSWMKYVPRAALNFLAVLIVGECIVMAIAAPRRMACFVVRAIYSTGMWAAGAPPM
jgi:hypothetical protein